MNPVTDPAILAAFNQQPQQAQQPITDPAILAAFEKLPPPQSVGVGEAVVRGAGEAFAGTANTLAMAGAGAATVLDKVNPFIGAGETPASDWMFKHVVEGVTSPALEYYQPQAGEHYDTAAEVGRLAGNLAGLVPQMVGMAPAAVVGGGLAKSLAMGATTGQAFALPACIYRAQQVVNEGVDTSTVMQGLGSNMALNTAAVALPVSMAGNLATRAVTGGAMGAGTGIAQRGAEGAILGDKYQHLAEDPFDPKAIAFDSILGGGMAGVFGKNSTGNKTAKDVKDDAEDETQLPYNTEQQAAHEQAAAAEATATAMVQREEATKTTSLADALRSGAVRNKEATILEQKAKAELSTVLQPQPLPQRGAVPPTIQAQPVSKQAERRAAKRERNKIKRIVDSAEINNEGHITLRGDTDFIAQKMDEIGVTKPFKQDDAITVHREDDIRRVLEFLTSPQSASPMIKQDGNNPFKALEDNPNPLGEQLLKQEINELERVAQVNKKADSINVKQQKAAQRLAIEEQAQAKIDAQLTKKAEHSQRAIESAKARKVISEDDSLEIFTRKMGGVNDGDFAKAFHRKQTGLKGNDTLGALTHYNGKSADAMAELAHEAGYIKEATPQALYDALDLEVRQGVKQYTAAGNSNKAEQDYNANHEPDITDKVMSETRGERDISYPEIPFSRKNKSVDGLTDKKLRTLSDEAIGAVIKRVGERHRVVTVKSFGDLASLAPDVIKQANKEGHDGSDVDGFIHKGNVYLIKENIARHKDPEAMAETVLLHEFTHGDIRNLFGKNISVELNKLFKAIGGYKGMKSIANKHDINLKPYVIAGQKSGRLPEARQAMLMDELLAFIGQDKPALQSKVKEIIGMIRQWLRDKGLVKLAEYGETDLLRVIREARKVNGADKKGTRFIVSKEAGSNSRTVKTDSDQGDVAFSKNTPVVDRLDALAKKEHGSDLGDGRFSTPIGEFKLGENQVRKLKSRGREQYTNMIRPTLENPLLVVKDEKGGTVFIKTFKGEDKITRFISVAYNIDGEKVVVSNHPKRAKQIENIIKGGEVLFKTTALGDKSLPQHPTNTKSVDAGDEGVKFSRSAKDEDAQTTKENETVAAAVKDYVKGKDAGATKVVSALLSRLFYKPAQVVRDYGVDHARIIGDKFLAEDAHEKRTTDTPDLITSRAFETGKFTSRLQTVMETLSNKFVMFDYDASGLFRGVPTADNIRLIRVLRTGKVVPRLKNEAIALRELLSDLRSYAIKAGLDIGELEHYFPRVYDMEKISKNKEKFIKFLEKNGFSNASAQLTMYKIINSEGSPELYGDTEARIQVNEAGETFNPRAKGKEGGASKKSYEKSRGVDIDEALLEKWLVNDVQAVVTQHINNVVRRAEYARKFGDNESELNADVRKMVEELESEGRQSEVKQAVSDVYDMADATMGKYRPIGSEFWRNNNRRMSDVMVMIHLPLVAFSSLPEFFAPIVHGGKHAVVPILKGAAVHGFSEAANSVSKMVTGKRLWKKSEWTQASEDMGLITQAALSQAVQARMGHKTGKWTNRFIRATMLEQMTGLQKVIANETFKAMMKSHAKHLEKGVTGKKRMQILQDIRDYGLSESQVQAWAKDGTGEAELRMAAISFTNKVITTPNEANTPLHVQNPHFAQLMLFKRFITVFSNTFLKRTLQQTFQRGKTVDAKMIGAIGAITMIAAAYAAQSIRDDLKWGEGGNPYRKKEEVGKRILDSVDRSGFTGSATWLYALFNPYRFGYTDKTSQRLFNLLGPAIGDASKTIDVFSLTPKSKRKAAEKQGKQLSKFVPVVNATEATRKPFANLFADILK
ncbi:MAG: PBECR2 nuclease fold domain-containing protein [Ghiorsea sp.]